MNGSDTPAHAEQLEEAAAESAQVAARSSSEAHDDVYDVGWWEWLKVELKYFTLRRKFLVNRRSQLGTAVLVTGLVLALVVLLNLTLSALRAAETRLILAEVPEAAELLAGSDRTEFILALLGSVVVVLGTFFMTIFETHRTAGAAFHIGRLLGKVANGELGTRLRLRRTDNLLELMDPFNSMTNALRDRAAEQADTLDGLAAQLEDPGSTEDVASRLRQMAKRTRAEAQSES